jgi:transposase
MRGKVNAQGDMLALISPESVVPQEHPLRRIKQLVDAVLQDLSPLFEKMYAEMGRPSIPPERLWKAKMLQALYTIRSENLLVESLHYNLLFRWFLDLNLTEGVWDNSTFSKNQERLLQHEVAEVFFAAVVELAQQCGWASDDHFTVDGTLIQAWASLKSFQPQPGPANPKDEDPGNADVDCKGQKRSNATHQSTTDPEAQLMRKGKGKEAKLSFGLHALMENRHGLCVQAKVTVSTQTESRVATELLDQQAVQSGKVPGTIGAEKGYPNAEFVSHCRQEGTVPHVAPIQNRKVAGLDGRTTRSLGYQTSQRIRQRVEEIFGWAKEIGGLRQTQHRGVARVGLNALLVLATYNLVRMGKLMGSSP